MLVLGINKILKWCQITNGGRTYTCPTKYINGELFFDLRTNGIKELSLCLTMQKN